MARKTTATYTVAILIVTLVLLIATFSINTLICSLGERWPELLG